MILKEHLVKASFIAKVYAVHTVHAALRDSHRESLFNDRPILKASFIAKVHAVHTVHTALRDKQRVRLSS